MFSNAVTAFKPASFKDEQKRLNGMLSSFLVYPIKLNSLILSL